MILPKLEKICPLAISYGSEENKSFYFITSNGLIKISNANNMVIKKILKYCNGNISADKIQQQCGLTAQQFKKLLQILIKTKIIIDSREIYQWFHDQTLENSNYKQPYDIEKIEKLKYFENNKLRTDERPLKDLTYFEKLLTVRKSTRGFSGNKVNENTIIKMLSSLYYSCHTPTVPSGGGIYPLRFYVFVINSTLKKGIYKYEIKEKKLIFRKKIPSKDHLYYIFQDKETIEKSAYIICIYSDLSIHPAKYSNRGYRYTLIEAGHSCQNAYIWASENKQIGVCAWGAMKDSEIKKLLNFKKSEYPIISLICGIKSKKISPFKPLFNKLNYLIKRYKDEERVIKSLSCRIYDFKGVDLLKYCAVAKFEDRITFQKRQKLIRGNGFGVSHSKETALIKGLAEAIERMYSCHYRSDVFCPYGKLKTQAMNPFELMPIGPKYYSAIGIKDKYEPFQLTKSYEWVKGFYLKSGKEIFILSDQVFYQQNKYLLGRKPTFKSNSSGVAAHFNQEDAIIKASLELLERDAFCVFWYGGRHPLMIKQNIIPENILEKIDFWKSQNRKIEFYDISLDDIPIVMCCIRGKEYPFFTAGMNASFLINESIEKALEEAEYALIAWSKESAQKIKISEIESPKQHGQYYATQDRFDKSKKLFISQINKKKLYKKVLSIRNEFDRLKRKYNFIKIILHEPNHENDLWVIRIVCPDLIPLNFGVGTEYFYHKRIKKLRLQWRDYPSPPHFIP